MMNLFLMFIALFVSACANGPQSVTATTDATVVGDQAAADFYAALEERLLNTDVLRVDYRVESTGAVETSLSGDLVTQQPAMAAIMAKGAFDKREMTLGLVSDGIRIRGGAGPNRFEQSVPQALNESLVVGLMRMGILHNLAMLSAGAPPDRADGNVRDWVKLSQFRTLKPVTDSTAILNGVGFNLTVDGQPAGEVRLWADADSGLPVKREQLVHFATSDMRVTEHYKISTGGIVGPCRFSLDELTL